MVVNFDPATNATQLADFRSKYGVSASVPIYGPFGGKLANGGEAIELRKPDPPEPAGPPNFGLVPYILVERVKDNDAAPWPVEADGTGLALHRQRAEEYGNDSINWTAGPAGPGSAHAKIQSVQMSGGSLVLQFNALAGRSYSVQYQNNLGSNTWTTLSTFGVQTTSGLRQAADPDALSRPARFYRLVTPAQ